jgi:hypothetical protein
VKRFTAQSLFLLVLILSSSKTVFAYDPYATGSATVTASVIPSSFNPPTITSPNEGSTTKNTREPLVWQRPNPIPVNPLHHYDIYLDGAIFASSISDSVTPQTYYFYTIYRTGNTFTLELNTDLSQGYHTWRVVAYSNFGISESSDLRTFYVDSIAPAINLQKVDRRILNWNTDNPSSIPDINFRDLTVYTPDPLLTGTVEPYANMQIILLCPQNIRNCSSQTYEGNYPTGIWQHRFYGLVRGYVYSVYLSATDAAGNSTIFPVFYLAYGVVTPTPSAVITPTATPTPVVSPAIPTPTITPEIAVIPTPFVPVPPVSPTPPVFNNKAQAVKTFDYFPLLLILLVLGLPLHLLMATFGAKISFTNTLRFLFTIFFPFVGDKLYQTTPFTTIEFYDPDKLDHPWQIKISNINGFYSLRSSIPSQLFTKITCTGRIWKNHILQSIILSSSCLFPIPESPLSPSNSLRRHCLITRSLPLAIACLTSAFCLVTQPNYFYLIYLYLSLQLVFSEYLYPKISK